MRVIALALGASVLCSVVYMAHGWATYRRVRKDTAQAIRAYEFSVRSEPQSADQPEPIPPQAA